MAVRLLLAAFPLAGVYLADLATEATDTAMVGRLGATEVAAASASCWAIWRRPAPEPQSCRCGSGK
jgi:Na+-driven multidrug efflux pump